MFSLLFQSFSSHPSRVFHAHSSRLSRKSAAVPSVGRAHSWRAVSPLLKKQLFFSHEVLVREPQRKEREFLKVGLREKRADLSFPVSPTRGRIRCGTIWLLAWMGIFQNFTFQKVKPNRTQVSSFLHGREIRPYSLVRRSRLVDYCSRLLDDSGMKG